MNRERAMYGKSAFPMVVVVVGPKADCARRRGRTTGRRTEVAAKSSVAMPLGRPLPSPYPRGTMPTDAGLLIRGSRLGGKNFW
jgi:hypothetical protein